MKKRLTSLFLVLALSFSLSLSAFAVDDIDFYSLSPVGGSEPSPAIDWPVSPAVEHDYTTQLGNIQINQQTQTNILQSIQAGVQAVNVWLGKIEGHTSRIKDYTSILSSISSTIGLLATEKTVSAISDKVATESSLSVLSNLFGPLANIELYKDGNWDVIGNVSLKRFLSSLYVNSSLYAKNDWLQPTLYSLVYDLKSVLASDDDKQLAENYKDNRVQAEQDFLSGKSGKTSLGKGDFSNASQIGGALNDTFNMGGASKVSDFVSGFGSAGEESLSWFSDTTANNLDSVTAAGNSTSGVSTFSDDGETMVDVDPDPYNMAEISERYEWLEGVLG